MNIIYAYKEKEITYYEYGYDKDTIELRQVKILTATKITPQTFMKMCNFFKDCIPEVICKFNSITYLDLNEAIKVLSESKKQTLLEKAETKEEIKQRKSYLLSILRRIQFLTKYYNLGYTHLTNMEIV